MIHSKQHFGKTGIALLIGVLVFFAAYANDPGGSSSGSGSEEPCVSACADVGIQTTLQNMIESGPCRIITLEVALDYNSSTSSGSSCDRERSGSRSGSSSGSGERPLDYIEIFTSCGTVSNVTTSCGDSIEILNGKIRVYRLPGGGSQSGSGSFDLETWDATNSSHSNSSSNSGSGTGCSKGDPFTITYTLCPDSTTCTPGFCLPMVGYRTGKCMQYEFAADPVPTAAKQPTAPDALEAGQRATGEVTAHPNPFNRRIHFDLELFREAETTLIITDLSGRRIKTYPPERLTTGNHTLTWDGTDHSGKPIANGIYYAQVALGAELKILKVVLSR